METTLNITNFVIFKIFKIVYNLVNIMTNYFLSPNLIFI